jgi:hypothetical protein
MIEDGLWVPRSQRDKRVHQPRNRRECFGELVQIDGSDHEWFERRGPRCTLLVYIDDATSKLVELRFAISESTFDYFAATRSHLGRHGKPVAYYSDKASIFRIANQDAAKGPNVTQFARALSELNIDIICANSSQAKGRVERANQTLQDRLVKELRLRGISSIEDGNAFVPEFMADFNRRFARDPKNLHNAHRLLNPLDDLDEIFTVQEQRKISENLTRAACVAIGAWSTSARTARWSSSTRGTKSPISSSTRTRTCTRARSSRTSVWVPFSQPFRSSRKNETPSA